MYKKLAMYAKQSAETEMRRVIGAFPRETKKGKTIDDLNREIAELSAIIATAKEILEKDDAE